MTAAKMKTIATVGGPVRVFAGGRTVADVEESAIPAKDIVRESSIIVKSRGHIGFTYYERPFTHKAELWSYTLDDAEVDQKFVYYYLLTRLGELQELARSTSVKLPQLSVRDTDNLKVPVPPLEVQREIVRILDNFTELEAELEAEREARRTQFDFYRESLIAQAASAATQVSLGEIVDLNWGDTNITKSAYVNVGERYLAYSAAGPDGSLDHFDYDRPAVVLSAIGALAGKTWRASGRWSCIKNTIRLFPLDDSVVTVDYLYWVTSTPGFWPRKGSAQPFIAKGDADKLQIPLPSLAQQSELVRVLDKFDALANDLSIGLPAELAARRKQYEYYRDKLLTFKELV